MVSKAEQIKFGIWMRMKEFGFKPDEIALFTGYEEKEVKEFFER